MSAPHRTLPRSEVLPAPRFRYSAVVVAGGFAFVAGMIGLDPATGALAAGGAYGQTRQVLANLSALAEEQGWALTQLVVVRVYCADFTEFPEINRAWDEVFGPIEPPARTTIGAAGLPLGARVELEFQFIVA